MMMNTLYTAIPVKVEAVDTENMSVDVLPLVSQVDNNNEAIEPSVIFNVPYQRMQGGKNAIIIDPQADDIGICIFAMRDISSVKANKAPSVPPSRRSYDPADGMYIGGILNDVPDRYVEITDDGVKIYAEKVQIMSGKVEIGNTDLMPAFKSEILAGWLKDHTHTGNLGAPTSPPLEDIPDEAFSEEVEIGG
jgi:hypothetical protein